MPANLQKHARSRFFRASIKGGSFLLGTALAVIAIWAFQLGIDNNPSFGPKRQGMLLLGVVFVLWALWDWIGPKLAAVINAVWLALTRISVIRMVQTKVQSILKKNGGISKNQEIAQLIARVRQASITSWVGRYWLGLSFILVSLVAVLIYFWIFSAGKMDIPLTGTRYYSWLADAFREGQLHLLTKPSPGLLSLPNPYDYRLRSDVNYIWDATLYEGKYFLYWGPVPAVIIFLLGGFTTTLIRDSFLTLGFVFGAFVFSALLLRAIWRRFGGKLPRWGFLGGLLALALNVPMIWLLTRPAVYEASIAGGQFFLLAGLFFGFLAVSQSKIKLGFLALAAFSWALTASTRVNLIPAIIFLSCMVVWWILQVHQWNFKHVIPSLTVFLLPLVFGALILAGYNYARFGSIFEFGHRYQLTGPALPANYDVVTDFKYSLPNLFNYLFRLPSFSGEFSFITIPWEKSWPFFIRLPRYFYSAEPVAGILWLVPVTGLALFSFVRYLWLQIDQSLPQSSNLFSNEDRSLLSWLQISLTGSASLQFALLLVFISSSLRYLADFTLIAILLATVFIARISAELEIKKIRKNLLTALWLGASGLTAAFAIVVNISGYALGFERNNPELYQYLLQLFH